MRNWNELKRLAEESKSKGEWYDAKSIDVFPEFHVDQDFMLACTPDAILVLIAENERLREEHDKAWRHAECNLENLGVALEELQACAAVLPGTYYMDPPDGGDVSVPEQLRRMAKDAERYRWLRERDSLGGDAFSAINEWLWASGDFSEISEAIDAAMSKGGQGHES